MNAPVASPEAVETVRAVSSAPAIRLRNVRKAYKIYDKPFSFLKEVLTGRPCHREKPVLHDISLDIGRGEVVGIIGRNGAGKSTLLKIIAGTLTPTAGSVALDGRVSAILELGTGFNPAYSGRDNVVLSALMRGMSEAEVRRKFDGIVAFAGLEEVIDEAFHTYSSGMQARLAFAAAVSVEADVIIIDEALAAGDARFVARSLQRIREICASGVTALFVSHTSYLVMQLCTRAIWLDRGRVRMDGAPLDVVRAYEHDMHERIARDRGWKPGSSGDGAAHAADGASDAAPAETHVAAPVPCAGVEPDPQSVPGPGRPEGGEGASRDRREGKLRPAPPGPAMADPQTPPGDAGDLAPVEIRSRPRRVATGPYRMLDAAFLDRFGHPARAFRFGDRLVMRVAYECLLPDLPDASCGLAVAFNRKSDFEAVMYFNTVYPHSDGELRDYFGAPFRHYVGRRGIVEATIDPIQLKAGEYYVSYGILPNRPDACEFYDYAHCESLITILRNGFDEPSVFYPMVTWRNGPPEDG